jgi:hypothetical protein
LRTCTGPILEDDCGCPGHRVAIQARALHGAASQQPCQCPGRWFGSEYFDPFWRQRSLVWAGRLLLGWEQGCGGHWERPLGTPFSHRLVPLDVLQLPFPLLWLRSIPPLRISRWCFDDCQMRHGLLVSFSELQDK